MSWFSSFVMPNAQHVMGCAEVHHARRELRRCGLPVGVGAGAPSERQLDDERKTVHATPGFSAVLVCHALVLTCSFALLTY